MSSQSPVSPHDDTDSIPLEVLHALRLRMSAPSIDQDHLFDGWPQNPEYYSETQVDLLEDLYEFEKDYEGGVEQYIINGRRLLDLRDQESEIYSEIEVPPLLYRAPSLYHRSDELDALEQQAEALMKHTVFVLVAGGMGERLGYSGAKVTLPIETASGEKYLQHYLKWALTVGGAKVPFVIMTSAETHQNTVALIKDLGMTDMEGLILLKQETVFCFADLAGHLALSKGKLVRKPHGHGDVHALLYRAKHQNGMGLVDYWLKNGYQHIAFFQDTNAAATMTIPITIAVSAANNLHMNFSCIPRLPNEAVGAICRTLLDDERSWRTVNIEYNIFDVVAQNLSRERGDFAAKDGGRYSAFPGSINNLVMDLPSYHKLLKEHHGCVPEFMNPKYTDDTCREFSKPARIESLMQDFAFFYQENEYRVGATTFARSSYHPVKNALGAAIKKVIRNGSPFCAASGEEGYYQLQRKRLRAIGIAVPEQLKVDVTIQDVIPLRLFPMIVIDAVAGRSGMLKDLENLFPTPDGIHISPGSTLIITGRCIVKSLWLDGALHIKGPSNPLEEPLEVTDCTVTTAKWSVAPLPDDFHSEVDSMRGFKFQKNALAQLTKSGLAADVLEVSKL